MELQATLHGWDIAVVVGYFILVLLVGIWSSLKSQRDSVSGYFLAGRGVNWILVGASLFASNFGTDHFIGLAGSGAATGIGVAGFELNALFIMLLLGWVFVPVYIASGVFTMPEYLRKRFGGQRIRVYLAVLALLLYIFTKISADLYAGVLFIKQSLDWNVYASIAVLLGITVVSTIGGGLTAVIWIDFVQAVIMVCGAIALSVMSFVEVGGYWALIEKYPQAEPSDDNVGVNHLNESCSKVPDNYMHLLRRADDPELPWPGMVFGLTIIATWYWCSDQVIVQRALSAKNLSHAKAGCILTGYLKILPLFITVFPGMAARILFPDVIGCSKPEACQKYCGSVYGCTNIAYPMLVLHLMPVGGRGLMMSVLTASLVANLASIFNSSSTLFTIDIWNTIRRGKASEKELLIVGRCFIVLLVAVSILWLPIIDMSQGSQLFNYINGVLSYLAPPVCAVYVLAISWDRINEPGAFWALMVGLVIGLSRFLWEYTLYAPPCGSGVRDLRPEIITKVHYLHFALLLFIITALVAVAVSLLTDPISPKKLHRLTFWSRSSVEPRENLDDEDGPAVCSENTDNSVRARGDQDLEGMQFDKKSCWTKAVYWLCSVDHPAKAPVVFTPDQEAQRAADSIHERPAEAAFCTLNGLLLLAVASFIYGFYA